MAIVVMVVIAIAAGASWGQDTNYWTQQYGTQGELLLGTVVGSIIDLSSVYYNPGTLALQKNPSLLLGAKAFEYQSISIDTSRDIEKTPKTQSFGPAPTLFAGIFPSKWFEGQLAYSVLTRNDFDFRIHTAGSKDLKPESPDSVADIGGEVLIEQDLTGVWGGPTWSRAWGKMGIGVSGFIAYQGQYTRNQAIMQGLRPSGEGATATFINAVNYWHFRLVFKAGVAWDYSPLTFGLAFTAPSIGLAGNGSSLFDFFSMGLDIDQDGTRDTELIANYFTDQPADYKSPGSISCGLSYRHKNTSVHISAEYFGPVDTYEVLPTQTFTSPTSGNTYVQKTTLELNSVFNWGIGIEQHIRDWLKAYGSFITDNSGYVGGTGTTVAVSNWDLKHIMGGAAFSFLGNDITLGLGYTWGSQQLPNVQYLNSKDGDANVPNLDLDAKLKFERLKLIIGFAFGTPGGSSGSQARARF
jgi:hypothetical protein